MFDDVVGGRSDQRVGFVALQPTHAGAPSRIACGHLRPVFGCVRAMGWVPGGLPSIAVRGRWKGALAPDEIERCPPPSEKALHSVRIPCSRGAGKLGVDERQSAERRNLLGAKHCPARRPKGVAYVVVPVSPARLTPIGLSCSVTLGPKNTVAMRLRQVDARYFGTEGCARRDDGHGVTS